MPLQIQDLTVFDNKRRTQEEHKPLYTPPAPEPVQFNEDVTEGVKALIRRGDHMAAILRRVLAGANTPKMTINNSLDHWDNVCEGFEK